MYEKLVKFALIFVALTIFLCLSSPIFGQEGPLPSGKAISPNEQGADKSGKMTPEQPQDGARLPEKVRVRPEILRQLQGIGEPGNLTSAEINAVTGLLEQIKREAKEKALQPAVEKPRVLIGAEKRMGKPPETEGLIQSDDVFFKKVPLPKPPSLEIFGHSLFTGPMARFSPITSMSVPPNYIIGPGDEIKILMWGRIDASHSLEVDRNGMVILPKIGPTAVAGLTFGKLEKLIQDKIGAISGVKVNVSMGKLRSIQVFALGEVKNPGIYTVSGMATVANVLHASGGPTDLGTMRKVELKRQGVATASIDFYDLLIKGDIVADKRLMPADVVFVPQTGPMVGVSGDVRRPAIYELKDDRTLKAALNLAGGLKPTAYNQHIRIERALKNREQIVLDISNKDLQGKKDIPLQDGDLIRVFRMLPFPVNAVYLYGNVLRPGEYAYSKGFRVLDVLPDLSSLYKNTYFDYAVIKRYKPKDMEAELIPFDLGRLFLSKDETQNIPLLPLDEIYVFNKQMFEDKDYATVKGQIRKPGRYLIDEMKIKDLILKAGDLKDDAYLPKAELIRTEHGRECTIYFDVARAMADDPEQNIPVQNEDRIIIHSIWEKQPKEFVTIKGEINNPGRYALTKEMTLKDLIFKAGSPARGAYVKRAELIRYDVVAGEKVEASLLSFNVGLAMQGNPDHNKKLRPMDVVYIKSIPEWNNREMSVTISGEVCFPGTYHILQNERLSDIVERAGGYTKSSYLRGAIFTKESIKKLQQQQLNEMIKRLEIEIASLSSLEGQAVVTEKDIVSLAYFISAKKSLLAKLRERKPAGRVVISLLSGDKSNEGSDDPVFENGDSLYVPKRPNSINVLGAVYNPMAYIYDKERPEIAYYLDKTGGPTENAEKGQIYVIRADGTAVSKQSKRDAFDKTVLSPGDTIMVPYKGIRPAFLSGSVFGGTATIGNK